MAFGTLPVHAQSDSDLRLKKVEAEVRALQRKVFPEGAGRTFEPEITGAQTPAQTVGAPSTSAITDILARLDAIEKQIQQLTAGHEENTNALRLLQDRVKLLESGAAPVLPTSGGLAPATPSPGANITSASVPRPAATSSTTPGPSGPTAARLAAVQAIEKPSTGDAGADDYAYGYRLWDAKLYPEAAQQLALFVEKYPSHPQISFGRNLLGRAYLDSGKPRDAAPWFLKNYQADKNGARAGDSLLYLGEAMIALKDTKRACIALAEFADTYPALAAGRLKSQFDSSRSKAQCK